MFVPNVYRAIDLVNVDGETVTVKGIDALRVRATRLPTRLVALLSYPRGF
jgi:hypothetical protein